MNLSQYKEEKPHHYKRIVWAIINATLFRILVGRPFKQLRNCILRLFGAKIPLASLVYPSCKIYAPWNLEVGQYSCIGPNTELYNKAPIIIGNNVVVSQESFLCTASHEITDPRHSLVTAPIVIGNNAWVAARAFVCMGVTIGEGAVVGATASVFKDVEPWTVVGGNPARFIKKRIMKQ